MNTRNPELSLSTGLGIGFTLVLFLMLGLTTIALMRMGAINARMERVVKVNNVKTAVAHEMKDALRDRAIIMHAVSLMTDPFDQNDEYLRFNNYGVTFSTARTKLMSMKMSAPEDAILGRMREVTIKTQPLVVQAIDKAMGGNQTEARDLIAAEIVPLQNQISSDINELIKLQDKETDLAVQEAAVSYTDTRLLIIVLAAVAAILGFVIAVVVIRHTNRQAKALQHQALFDNLTNLPNRTLFADRLQQAILIGRRERESFALLALDLDRFKEINDNLGHHVGDEVLRQVANRMRDSLRESDTVARMGGDEFNILLPTVSHLDGACAVARKLVEEMKEPLQIGGHSLEGYASIGIAMFPLHSEAPDTLMRQADAAMYMAKRAQSGFMVYDAELDQEADERVALRGDLRRAIANGELILHYQPKIDFENSQVSGVEALVRWQHPKHGLLYPDKFILLAEETGLIKLLTEAVLKVALRQCEEWHKAGLELSMAVNISTVNIQDPDFPDQVAALLEQVDVPPSRLELEVTETAVMTEPVRAVECIKKLSALGLQISIDDFGTGYSSMSYLKELLVAKIKIDRSFVKDMNVSHNDAVIVRSTVELGHNLGLKVIAEGVENQPVWDRLKLLGCDSAQGYYMGRPVPADQFAQWLKQSEWGLAEKKE